MKRAGIAFVSGALFTAGLNLSGMTHPRKILGFLDFTGLYTGKWDPSLIVVMLTALAVHAVLYRLILSRQKPLVGDAFVLPPAGRIDAKLVVGSLVWGAGWGITGLCPGPILAAVGDLNAGGVTFFGSMIGGMWIHHAVFGASGADEMK